MEQILLYIDEYGLLVVIAGIVSSILCGCIKIPIIKVIKKRNLGEKAVANRTATVCTFIVTVFSILLVVSYLCLKAKSFIPLRQVDTYSQILLAVSFAKIAYMFYEGVGVVSIKKGLHALVRKILESAKSKKASTIEDYISITQEVLSDILHMPLTDSQKEILKEKLSKSKIKDANDVQDSLSNE